MCELNKRMVDDCRLWIGWFVYKRCAHNQFLSNLQELAGLGEAVSPGLFIVQMAEHQEYRKKKKTVHRIGPTMHGCQMDRNENPKKDSR